MQKQLVLLKLEVHGTTPLSDRFIIRSEGLNLSAEKALKHL